jgi:hypothetical protein
MSYIWGEDRGQAALLPGLVRKLHALVGYDRLSPAPLSGYFLHYSLRPRERGGARRTYTIRRFRVLIISLVGCNSPLRTRFTVLR